MELQEGIRILTDEKKIITGIALSLGNAERSETCCYGSLQEVTLQNGEFVPAARPVTEHSVFDLASVTKFFTALSVMQLVQKGAVRLSDPVVQYDPRFRNLSGYSVFDLLAFQKAVSSPKRIDTQPDRAHALAQLFSCAPSPRPERRYYTDMGAIILKYVVESASGTDFFSYVKHSILDPLGMHETYAVVPEERYPETACYNYERRVLPDGTLFLDTSCPVGTVHDPKARAISPDGSDLCGHAGLYSTVADMTKLAQGVLRGEILDRTYVSEIGKNRTGHLLPDGTHSHYLGYLCYAKHPIQTYSEVPSFFTDGTIALNGFTGNHFSIDPNRNMFLVQLSNRIHNRFTVVTGRPDPANRMERYAWTDGTEYPVSQNYVYYKDEYLKNPSGRILEERYRGAE